MADWDDTFFEALKTTGMVMEACKAVDKSRVYVYKRRKKDQAFAERWEDVLERSTEVLEQVVLRRAVEGSDTLAMFLLKARRPGVYRDNVHHDHDVKVGGQITLSLDGHDPIEIESAKRRELSAALADEFVDSTAEDLGSQLTAPVNSDDDDD